MGRLEGAVVLITGAARGQGRSHAVRMAEEGADIIAIDICDDIATVSYPMATKEELAETARLVEALGRQVVTARADIRDLPALEAAVQLGVDRLGPLTTAVANAGICAMAPWDEVTPDVWRDVIDVNLTGTWNTCTVAAPHLIAGGRGALILVSSTAGLKGLPFLAPYAAAKHGMVGIMRVLANELAEHGIRVNSVHPTGVNTPMTAGTEGMDMLFSAHPNLGPVMMNTLPVDRITSREVSDAVVYLASDEARHVTGLTMTIDAGATAR